MNFCFQFLGLLVMLFLVIQYYSRVRKLNKDTSVFRGILVISYLMQLFYGAVYIAISNGQQEEFYVKGYFVFMVCLFSLFTLYSVFVLLKDKYQNKRKEFERNISFSYKMFGIVNVISLLVILFSNIRESGLGLRFCNGVVIEFFIGFYLLIQFLILVCFKKNYSNKNYVSLMGLFLLEILLVFLQYYFDGVDILNSGSVFLVLYLYMMIGNPVKEELDVLKVERDYAVKHNLDKSSFLKNLSHEIRTPINTIDGFSQVILESDSLEDIKEDILDIRSASRDLIDIINGMIDLSILESGNLEVISEHYNVYDMFDNICDLAKSKMRGKEVEFVSKIGKNVPEVLLGDAERISQVILNLLTNSIKYTEKGTIEFLMDSVQSSAMCRLKITVRDTGRGIKKEEIEKLFDQNGENERKGLGLILSKHLIELMGGTIEVESSYGKGSEFVVTIDQKITKELDVKRVRKNKVIKPFQAVDKRILIVDDNKMNLKVAKKLLMPYQVEVVEVSSGSECLDILENDKNFDLILMDDMMPNMSGTECLDVLKKIQRIDGFYIPVVVLTANAIAGMKEKYIELGFEDYLAKPIEKEELDRVLRSYLKK